tara:strand:- start:316 stop:957 length:642 start_codon:yes stop_codon:yes gene_type:complete
MAKRKIKAQTDNSKWEAPKKRRKPRKPMSQEQRIAAAERLEKARAVRAENNPNYGKSGIHESLHNLPDDHQLSPNKIKKWIKTQKDLLKTERQAVRQNVKGAIAKVAETESYIRNMQKYLRDGDWVDMFYGEYAEKRIRNRCVALSYYWYGPKKGEPKRDVGTFYPDMGCVYTQEMADEEREITDVRRERKTDGRSNSRTVAKNKKKSKNTRR